MNLKTHKHIDIPLLDNKKDVFAEKIELQKKLAMQTRVNWRAFNQKPTLKHWQKREMKQADRKFQNQTFAHFRAA